MKTILSYIFLLLLIPAFGQDAILLTNNERITGKIVEVNKKDVLIKTGKKTEEFPLKKVYQITYGHCELSRDTIVRLANSENQAVEKGGRQVLQKTTLTACQGDMIYIWGSAEMVTRGSTLGTLQINIFDANGKLIDKTNVRTHGRRGSPEVRDQMSVFYPFKVPKSASYSFELVASNSPGSIGGAKFLFDRFLVHLIKK